MTMGLRSFFRALVRVNLQPEVRTETSDFEERETLADGTEVVTRSFTRTKVTESSARMTVSGRPFPRRD